jgi:hypothetical protein
MTLPSGAAIRRGTVLDAAEGLFYAGHPVGLDGRDP